MAKENKPSEKKSVPSQIEETFVIFTKTGDFSLRDSRQSFQTLKELFDICTKDYVGTEIKTIVIHGIDTEGRKRKLYLDFNSITAHIEKKEESNEHEKK